MAGFLPIGEDARAIVAALDDPALRIVSLTITEGGYCIDPATGTFNPGIIWYGRHYQLGLEASVPVNHASGNHTGMFVQLHFYIDDLFPNSLGKPFFK